MVLGAAAAVLTTASFGAGCVAWFGMAVTARCGSRGNDRRWFFALTFAGILATAWVIARLVGSSPDSAPGVVAIGSRILIALSTPLGSFAGTTPAQLGAGAFVLLVLACLCGRACRAREHGVAVGWCAFGLLVAATIGIGRARFPETQTNASRYACLVAPAWIGGLVLAYRSAAGRRSLAVVALVVGLLGVVLAVTSLAELDDINPRATCFRRAVRYLRDDGIQKRPWEVREVLFDDVSHGPTIQAQVRYLTERRLSFAR